MGYQLECGARISYARFHPSVLRYINRAEWLSQTSILRFQTEIGRRGQRIKQDFEVTEMETCAENPRVRNSGDETKCLRSDPHEPCHDSACVSDVLPRIKIPLLLWQTSAAYKKCIDWMERNLLTSTSFLISPVPLRIQHSVFLVIGNAAETLTVKDKNNFGQDG